MVATDRAAARASYERSRVIRERLAAADPGNLTAQRDVSLIYDRIGNIHTADERYEDALAIYRAELCDPREDRAPPTAPISAPSAIWRSATT